MQTQQLNIHLIGNAHLDPVWLWRWQDGFAEIKATFRSALDRMDEFDDFIFTCAGAAYYQWIEHNAPEMFREIQSRVAQGRWIIVGGWWIQPDCNLPSGESFVRHSLYSQHYFLSKFERMAEVGYNVDSFGHHGMIPQILKGSGMDAYVMMRPFPEEKPIPENTFWWEGTDGTRVMTFRIPPVYSTYWNVAIDDKLEQLKEMALRENKDQMCFYGVGNHGGGPTIRNLHEIHEKQKQENQVNFFCSSPNIFFNMMRELSADLPVVSGDLQHHAPGCYSVHSETKALNRRAEHRLLTAEKYATLAYRLCGQAYPAEQIQAAWEPVMFNHFHDILGGCSIKEAYDDARDAYGFALHQSAIASNAALQKISWSVNTSRPGVVAQNKDKHWRFWEQGDLGTPVVVFNPHTWATTMPIEFPHRLAGVTDEQGNAVLTQKVRASRTNIDEKYDTLVMAPLPALGYRLYWIYLDAKHENNLDTQLSVTNTTLENAYVKIEVDTYTGYLKSYIDKSRNVDYLLAPAAVPIVIDEHHMDTWAHDYYTFRDEIGKFTDAKVKVMETGPIRATIRATSFYGQSMIQQDFTLYYDRPELSVKVKLDLRDQHRMIKLSFPIHCKQSQVTYEIPYGHMIRPATGEEEPAQQWIDLSGISPVDDQRIGMSLLNDSKYSFDVLQTEMRMTVARSAMYAEHKGERDDWNEFIDQGIQYFNYSLVPHQGNWKQAGVVRKAYECNLSAEFVVETYHHGQLPAIYESIQVSNPQVMVTVFKRSEDQHGYVLRAYETAGEAAEVEFNLPILGVKFSATFRPLEIKTFKIFDESLHRVVEVNLLEMVKG